MMKTMGGHSILEENGGLLSGINGGMLNYRYKEFRMLKDPFDIALLMLLLGDIRPRTIIEIGTCEGGGALWMADQLTAFGVDGHIYSMDKLKYERQPCDPRVTFLLGDGRNPDEIFPIDFVSRLPRPLLVIEDSDHFYETSKAVLDHFGPMMRSGEYLIIEDGIEVPVDYIENQEEFYNGGPVRAIYEFLQQHPIEFIIDRTYCDFFGHNATYNLDGYLRCV